MVEKEQEIKKEMQEVEYNTCQPQIQMLDGEAQDGSSTKEEEKRAGCTSRRFIIHGLKEI